MPDRNESVCFERTSLPPEAQLSSFPEEDEQDVKYFRGIFPPHQVGASPAIPKIYSRSCSSPRLCNQPVPMSSAVPQDVLLLCCLQEELQRNETLVWEQFAQWVIQPPSACPHQCSRRGYCLKKTFDLPETAPFCECYFGWQV
jgi:hypothetical protein